MPAVFQTFTLSYIDHAYTPLPASVKENAMVFSTGFSSSLIFHDKFILLINSIFFNIINKSVSIELRLFTIWMVEYPT